MSSPGGQFRRGVLALAVGVLLLLSGCAGLSGTLSTHHEIHVKNYHNTTHSFTVELKSGRGETVLTETRDLAPDQEWHVTTQNVPGEYSLHVQADSRPTQSTEYTLPLAEGNRQSFTVIRIRPSGELHVRTYWQE